MKPETCLSDWHNLYKRDYDLQVPESTAHPAKMAWDLTFKILSHLRELGLLKDGDTVMDPMGGTGRTALAACSLGYRAVTVELEPRFVGFQKANLEYASRKLGRQLDWTILHGDARKLSELVKPTCKAVMSPPYFDSDNKGARTMPEGYWEKAGGVRHLREVDYGATPGQIGNLKDRPLKCVTSPPYEDNVGHGGRVTELDLQKGIGGDLALYGHTEGQIADGSYLDAMRQVYAEIAKVADVLAVVTKNPTRNGKLRRLALATASLLEDT